jgi:hypothetical protein
LLSNGVDDSVLAACSQRISNRAAGPELERSVFAMTYSTTTFICGCGHSGTSLLANMFASHPDVYVPLRETETFLSATQFPRKWSALVADWRENGRIHLVEKTPRHVRCLDRIRETVATAQFVIMVRDARDVAASFVKRLGSAGPGIERWLADNSFAAAEMAAPDVLIVRYEDLVADAKTVLHDTCRFIGIEFNENMLNYHRAGRMWFGVNEFRKGTGASGIEHRLLRNWQINQPLFDGRDQWIGILTPDDLNRLNAEDVRALMLRFGYEDMNTRPCVKN